MSDPRTRKPAAVAPVAFSDAVDQQPIDHPRRRTTSDARTRRVHFTAAGVRR
jgi:hypothetical protein